MAILEFAEFEIVHAPSMGRARASGLAATFMAEGIYNRACFGIPAREHPQMMGPANISEDRQVKEYTSLTVEDETVVYHVPAALYHGPARAA